MAVTKLVIIGGVAGGATAAARARRLSEEAEIVVFERGPNVSFANCGLPYHIGGEIAERESLILQTPEALHERHNLDVHVRTEVQAIDREKKELVVKNLDNDQTYREPYDKLIISTGAAPIRPPLPGIDHPRIRTLRNIPDTDAIKKLVDDGAKSAIVVGGGFIGLEMAENLHRRGLTVHIVELLDQVMPPLDKEMATAIHQVVRLCGVNLHLGDAVESFEDAGENQVVANLKSGPSLQADLIVLSIGVRPESGLAKDAGLELGERGGIHVDEHMRTNDSDIYAVGDAVQIKDFVTHADAQIPLAGPANRQARIAADNIFGRESTYRGTQGTSVVRVFNLNVAMTGASEKVLRRSGIEYEKVYLHPGQHVDYFPGAAQMHLKLLFAKPDGRILGAQITGGEGVDKRIDVLAVAIQSGMTVFDLEEVELAYAPQFGAAKDPINMAGFVAANVLRGDVEVIHADGLGDAFLVDVRDEEEHTAGAIPGAKLIPLNTLRQRHGELPKDRLIVTHCAMGLRGYLGARVLKQLGYNVRNLSGGHRTWAAFNPREDDADTGTPTTPSDVSDSATTSCCTSAETNPSCASQTAAATKDPTQVLDVRSAQCPGPIIAMKNALDGLEEGRILKIMATDPGFAADVPAWCRQTGHELVNIRPENNYFAALIRKRTQQQSGDGATASAAQDKTIVVFSNDLDRVMAAFIIANGAASMGKKVTLFFTFWGLNVLRRDDGPQTQKPLMDRMFGWMMPRGPQRLKLSKMHMAGMGTAMMRGVMKKKNVASLPELIATARNNGVRLVACAMSMDVMGIRQEELIDEIEIGGVGAYLDAADNANVNLFI